MLNKEVGGHPGSAPFEGRSGLQRIVHSISRGCHVALLHVALLLRVWGCYLHLGVFMSWESPHIVESHPLGSSRRTKPHFPRAKLIPLEMSHLQGSTWEAQGRSPWISQRSPLPHRDRHKPTLRSIAHHNNIMRSSPSIILQARPCRVMARIPHQSPSLNIAESTHQQLQEVQLQGCYTSYLPPSKVRCMPHRAG